MISKPDRKVLVYKGKTKHYLPTDRLTFDKVALRRRICRESYWDFCQEFWGEVIAEEMKKNWHMRVMADEFQKSMELVFQMKPKEYDLIFNVPPGSSKSSILSLLSCPWCWTRMPSLRFLGISWDADLSLDIGNKARRVVRCDLYQETFPSIVLAKDQDTKGFFGNTKGGERRATSIGANIIGRHSHVHVVDDPLSPAGTRSEADNLLANLYLKETLPSRCVDQSITPQILVMQRLGVDDPTATRLGRTRGTPVKHFCFPAILGDNVLPKKFRHKYKYVKKFDNYYLDPKRLGQKVLDNKLEELHSYGFAGQFLQQPVPISGGMFLWQKVRILPCPPVKLFERVYRWWDKAATSEGDGAYSAGVLLGVLLDKNAVPRFWVLDSIRGRWDTHAREQVIKNTAAADLEKWGRKMFIGIEQEPGSGGKDSAKGTIYNLAGYKVIAERATGEKFDRAVPFSDQANAGNVAIAKGGLWIPDYIEEMKYFGPGCKYLDQIDCCSAAFNKLFKRRMRVGAGGF